jgi:transcriptional regulator with XRE-family HTH domain
MYVEMDGEKVRGQREARGFSKKALAEAATVTQATVGRAERSRRVYPATAELIAEALGADPCTLGQRAGAISLPSQGQRQFP